VAVLRRTASPQGSFTAQELEFVKCPGLQKGEYHKPDQRFSGVSSSLSRQKPDEGNTPFACIITVQRATSDIHRPAKIDNGPNLFVETEACHPVRGLIFARPKRKDQPQSKDPYLACSIMDWARRSHDELIR
jgi:hypothetical protein